MLTRSYLDLHDSERPLSSPPFMPSLTDALTQVFEYLEDQESLLVDRSWTLAPEVVDALTSRAGYSPAGGWSSLASLAAGADILATSDDRFVAAIPFADFVTLDEHTLRRRLLEAATIDLVPPAFAASLGVFLDYHPAWALRAVRSLRADEVDLSEVWRDDALFCPERIERLSSILADALACLVATLRSLRPSARYDLHALTTFAADLRSVVTREERKTPAAGHVVFVHALGQLDDRAVFELVMDLFDLVLVPAGAARRFDDGSFCVFAGAFDQVRVAELDVEAQRARLAFLLPAAAAVS